MKSEERNGTTSGGSAEKIDKLMKTNIESALADCLLPKNFSSYLRVFKKSYQKRFATGSIKTKRHRKRNARKLI